jgi:hypothetical protein
MALFDASALLTLICSLVRLVPLVETYVAAFKRRDDKGLGRFSSGDGTRSGPLLSRSLSVHLLPRKYPTFYLDTPYSRLPFITDDCCWNYAPIPGGRQTRRHRSPPQS